MIKPCVVYLLILVGQMATGIARTVVHLNPNQVRIPLSFEGDLLELINSPAALFLPPSPPKPNSEGVPWGIYVKNLGPAAVSVECGARFHISVGVGQTVQIVSDGSLYSVKR